MNGGFTFTRTGSTAQALTINFSIGGTAGNGADYAGIGSSFVIPAGQAAATLPIVVLQDNLVEPTETVVLSFTNSGTYTISPPNATVNIADDPPVVVVTTTDGSEAGPVAGSFKFARTGGNLAQALAINFNITGSAGNGADYAGIGSSFVIPAAASNATLPITVLQDNLVEPTETVILTYTNNGTYVISPAASTVNIADDPPVVTVTTTDGSEVGPVAGSFKFARTGGNLAQALAINFNIGGTAGNGSDYAGIGSSFVIPAGQLNGTLPITVLPDNLVEPTETVILTFTNNGTYNITPPSATVNITDSAPVVTVTTTNASEVGLVPGSFKFARTGGDLTQALAINFNITGTAGNGADYAGIGSSFVIPANQANGTLTITPLPDNLVEPTETVILTFVNNGTYNISPPSATVSIADNPPVVTVTTTNGSEAGPSPGSFHFVRAGGDLNQALAVNFNITGTAGNGADYAGIGSSFVIPAGKPRGRW